MMDATRLMTLARVEDRGGVVAAAAALHLTPSAVSQQLRQLEREANVALLDRSRRQVSLTEAGRRLADRGRRIAREAVLAADDLSPWTAAADRTVTIASFQTVICQLIAPLINGGRLHDAGITVRIVEDEGPSAIDALHAGEVDVVMAETLLGADPASQPSGRDPVTRLVIDDRYLVVAPTAWALPADPDQVRSALATGPWISQADDTVGGAMLADLMQRWAFSAHIVHVCREYPSAVALVEAGVGATLTPRLALPLGDPDGSAINPRVQVLHATPDLGTRRVSALCRPTRRVDPVMHRVLALLADQARAIGLDARQMGPDAPPDTDRG